MRKIFEADLRQVGEDLIAMSQAVEKAIDLAGRALLTADIDTAQQVIEGDALIDAMQRALDERCVHILAQQAPVATDLRTIVAALRMSATLERMGDLARHVAEVARGRYPAKALRPAVEPTFARMIDAARTVAQEMTTLLGTRDLDLAAAIGQNDDILDNLHTESYNLLLSPQWDGSAQEAVDITLIGRFLERFGDHATTVARRIVFLVTGEVEDGPNHG